MTLEMKRFLHSCIDFEHTLRSGLAPVDVHRVKLSLLVLTKTG